MPREAGRSSRAVGWLTGLCSRRTRGSLPGNSPQRSSGTARPSPEPRPGACGDGRRPQCPLTSELRYKSHLTAFQTFPINAARGRRGRGRACTRDDRSQRSATQRPERRTKPHVDAKPWRRPSSRDENDTRSAAFSRHCRNLPFETGFPLPRCRACGSGSRADGARPGSETAGSSPPVGTRPPIAEQSDASPRGHPGLPVRVTLTQQGRTSSPGPCIFSFQKIPHRATLGSLCLGPFGPPASWLVPRLFGWPLKHRKALTLLLGG